MKFKIIISISLIMFIISLAAVSAADANNMNATDTSHLNDESLAVGHTLSTSGDIHKSGGESNILNDDISSHNSISENKTLIKSNVQNSDFKIDNQNIKLPGYGLKALQDNVDIYSQVGHTLNLNADYKYGGDDDCKTLTFNNNLTIDGQGHTIDFKDVKGSFIKSSSGIITLKNLNIKNWYNAEDGAAFDISGTAQFFFENCKFETAHGGAICNDLSKKLTFKNCIYQFNSDDSVSYDDLNLVSMNKDVVNLWVDSSGKLKNIFNYINQNNPSWNTINLTLAPNTIFKVNYNTYSDSQFKYGLRFAGNTMVIKGNPGSVIAGDNQNNNFMYISPGSQLSLCDVTLKSFNHCFINFGSVYGVNSTFSDNKFNYAKKTKADYRQDIYGAVIANYNYAWFENCTFANNQAHYNNGGCWGSILHGVSNSLTYFDRCSYKNCGDDFIYAEDSSSVVMIQDHKLNKEYQNCYFDKSSSLCAISTDILNDNTNQLGEINCSNSQQLKEALYTVNSLLPNSNIVINLKTGVYEISADWMKKGTGPRSLDWRDEKHHPSVVYKSNKASTITDEIALDVGVVPITINGNGSTIKMIGNNGNDNYIFSHIAYGGVLTVNNVTFSRFNHLFNNYGTINMNNCTFDNNYARGGNTIAYGNGCSNYFTNCTFKQSDKIDSDYPSLFNIKSDSYLKIDNCDFKEFFKTNTGIGKAESSTVEGPSNLKNKINIDSDSVFYSLDDYVVNDTCVIEHESIFDLEITSNNYYDKLNEIIKEFSPNTILMNFTVDGEVDLSKIGFNGNILLNANSHNILFKSSKINKYLTLTINNLDFSNYESPIFNVYGVLNLVNCTFTNNAGKYIIDNSGSCNIVNCTFTGNNNDNNLFNNNNGVISINGGVIENNTVKDALIYNNGGYISCHNSTLSDNVANNNRIVCNYQTSNCQIFNTTNIKQEFTQPITMELWKKIAIRVGIGAGVAALSFLGGFGIGYALTAFVHPAVSVILGGVWGASVGVGGGYLDDFIIGGYEHDHSNKYTTIAIYAGIGALAGAVGAGCGAYKYLKNAEFKENLKKIKGAEPDVVTTTKNGGNKFVYNEKIQTDTGLVIDTQRVRIDYSNAPTAPCKVAPEGGVQHIAQVSTHTVKKSTCWFVRCII